MKSNYRSRKSLVFLVCLLMWGLAVLPREALGQIKDDRLGERTVRLLSRVDRALVQEFKKAWVEAMAGALDTEGVVVIFALRDGSLKGRLQKSTNQFQKVSFIWNHAAVAVAHTHPNRTPSPPSAVDQELARRLGVPVFTMTCKGMYVYDPTTMQVSLVHKGISWLEPSTWEKLRFELTKKAGGTLPAG